MADAKHSVTPKPAAPAAAAKPAPAAAAKPKAADAKQAPIVEMVLCP